MKELFCITIYRLIYLHQNTFLDVGCHWGSNTTPRTSRNTSSTLSATFGTKWSSQHWNQVSTCTQDQTPTKNTNIWVNSPFFCQQMAHWKPFSKHRIWHTWWTTSNFPRFWKHCQKVPVSFLCWPSYHTPCWSVSTLRFNLRNSYRCWKLAFNVGLAP